MSRKLYALFILIGAIGAIILTYIYFFVYYTATLSINANIPGYTVELFSKSTAQKWSHECPQQECIIAEVSPFEYNISISKQDYKTIIIPVKIAPRKRQNFVIEFEPDTDLKLLEKLELEETAKQKIQRLREQSKYFETFRLDEATQIIFDQDQNGLEMKLQTGESIKTISRFPLVAADMIRVEYIGESWEEIFLKIAESYYIFNTKKGKIYSLPYELPIHYIKPGKLTGQYLIVSEKGTFLYNISTENSDFQYLFKDFVYYEDALIGVIYKDEEQKKSNFNLTESGNLIVRYTQDNKERKVLMDTALNIDRIEWKGEKIVFTAGENEYELKNF